MTPMDKGTIDIVCIYCPETDECYYVRPDAHGTSVTLRIVPSRNGQQAGVLDAAAFRDYRGQFPADPQRKCSREPCAAPCAWTGRPVEYGVIRHMAALSEGAFLPVTATKGHSRRRAAD
jgi:hypothetical protein